MFIATQQSNSDWHVYPPLSVNDPFVLFKNLISFSPKPGCILSGFDFPIGLPYHYAMKAGVSDFISALSLFGHKKWSEFFLPSENPSQINLFRPFYPKKPGGSKRQHLERGLDLPVKHLYRLCENAHKNRRAACPLFWTLGRQQVGKAAISGWQLLITPALVDPELSLKIWPFSGSLDQLCLTGNIVTVETYPAEFYGHLGLFSTHERKSKRRQVDRMSYAGRLITWSEDHLLRQDDSLITLIKDGFGDSLDGEDRFDALIGLYGMINVVQGNHPTGEPVPPHIAKIEGWIFGQDFPKEDAQLAGTIK